MDEHGEQNLLSLLESTVLSKQPKLKFLTLRYFNVIAVASYICVNLLVWIQQIKAKNHIIRRAFNAIIDDECLRNHMNTIASEPIIIPPIFLTSPISIPNEHNFASIRDEYSSSLICLKSQRKKVAKKIRLIRFLHKAMGIFVTATCDLVEIKVMVITAHMLTGLLMGPAIFSFLSKSLKRKMSNLFESARTQVLEKVGEQLDIEAKGTYILDRDFDMIRRLVLRLGNEINHNKTLVRLCLMRREGKISEPLTKELKKRNDAFQGRVAELEEHLYLCLATIKRAKDLAVLEMTM